VEEHRKGIALILCYLVIAVLITLGVISVSVSLSERTVAKKFADSMQAFWLAEAGLNRAMWYLTRTPSDTDTAPDGSQDGSWRTSTSAANLSSDASSGQNQVVVDEAGIFSVNDIVIIKDNDNEEMNTVIGINGNTLTMQNSLRHTYTTDAAAIVDPGYTELLGEGSYTIWVHDSEENIRIYSRGKVAGLTRTITQTALLTVKSGAFDYALYVGGYINDQQGDLSVDGKQKENAGTENLPTIDFTYYEALAAGSDDDNIYYISGNYTFPEGTEGNPLEYNGMWYVDGNVNIGSYVNINGGIISTGNVSIDRVNNINITASTTYPALITQGKLDIKNSADIEVNGLVYVGADLDGNMLAQRTTSVNITGTLLVAGNFNLQQSNTVSVTYDASQTQNLQGISGGETEITITPQTDWDEI